MDVVIRRLGRGVVVECVGVATVGSGIDAVSRMQAFEGFTPDTPAVWDFSRAGSGSLFSPEMKRIGAHLATVRRGAGTPRVAIVAPGDAEFGSARMFAGVNESQVAADFRVFRKRDEALEWALGVGLAGDGADS